MGGRGGGSPAGRVPEGSVGTTGVTRAEARDQVIVVTVVDKQQNETGGWRTIGDVPQSYTDATGIEGLWVARDGQGYSVRDIVTDQVLARGRSIKDSLRALAKRTGVKVIFRDETAGNKILGTFG